MVRSLIAQLSNHYDDTWKKLDSLFASCNNGKDEPSLELLCEIVLHGIEQAKEVWIIIDALDECHTRKAPSTEGLLSWISKLLKSEQRNVHLLVTSRPEQDIISDINKYELACNEDIIPIQNELIGDDIHAYIETTVKEDDRFERWRSRPKVQAEIITKLTEKADGM
jgi:hypothetical protein